MKKRHHLSEVLPDLLWNGALAGIFMLSPFLVVLSSRWLALLWLVIAVCVISAIVLHNFNVWSFIRFVAVMCALGQVGVAVTLLVRASLLMQR
jgi:hypothetical protein